jgi:3' terminal RNA ribose 2'-O-methyltransferase Hen1
VYTSALNGNCRQRPELVDTVMPLEVMLSVLPCRGGPALLEKLFAPLGYTVQVTRHPLDPHFPEWGDSPYYTVTLTNTLTVQALLSHLYVLIPVLDNEKHYWIGQNEVEKLLEKGEGWLAAHPEKEFITKRYLRYIGSLTRQALARLLDEEGDAQQAEEDTPTSEEALEKPISLNQQRLSLVVEQLKHSGAKSVLDLGCGEGRLLRLLLKEKQFERIVGMDVSYTALEHAKDRLHVDDMSPRQKARIELLHGSLMYRDIRLEGFDAAAVVEVIEHLDAARLQAFERILFECIRPQSIVLTTPNIEYNARFENLAAGALRHHDHRFEWTRREFQAWSNCMAEQYGYSVIFHPVGPEDAEVGAPTQMAVFVIQQ